LTKKSKLNINEHEEEAKSLRKDGKGWIEIANCMNRKYPDDGGYSHMAIKRGLASYEKSLVEQMMDEGENPIAALDKEFHKEIRKIIKRTSKFMEIVREMVDNARKSGDIGDMSKALTLAFKGLPEERRNWESLLHSTFGQVKNIGEVNANKEQDIKILINNFSGDIIKLRKELCDDCKKKADELIEELFANK